jgi:FkbM family methyltransferase
VTKGDHGYRQPRPGVFQSQHGEDRWLNKYFAGKTNGFFVEVGAYDGVVLSNSYFFETIGWSGILVEPHHQKAQMCRENRPGSRVFECAAVASSGTTEIELLDVPAGEVYSTVAPTEAHLQRLRDYGLEAQRVMVSARTLDSILEEVNPPRIDFVSIDVEGAEIQVLQGFDIRRWSPRLVMVESMGPRPDAVRDYFTDHGYAYLHSVNINDIYRPVPKLLQVGGLQVTAALDGAWYTTRKKLHALREKVRLRTRLRQLRLWR